MKPSRGLEVFGYEKRTWLGTSCFRCFGSRWIRRPGTAERNRKTSGISCSGLEASDMLNRDRTRKRRTCKEPPFYLISSLQNYNGESWYVYGYLQPVVSDY